jgi:general secretion pathway protein B
VIGALLVVNFVVVGFVLWRGSATRAPAPAAVVASGTAAPTQIAAVAEPRPEPRADSRAAPSAAPSAVPSALPSAAGTPAAATAVGAPVPGGANTVAAATVPAVSGSGAAPAGENPDDLAPAVEARRSASQPVGGIIRATDSGLPTYQDAAAEPGANLPNLKLDLHVYDAQPDQRFVFLEADAHMLRLREGDTTPQGVRVEHITQDGVILSYGGKEFVLQRQ